MTQQSNTPAPAEPKPMELLKSAVPELKAIMKLNAADGVDVETLALQELEYIRMAAINTPAILDCMPQTIIMAVKSVLKQNLSMDPASGLVYIKTRNVNMKVNGADNWKKALEITPTCNGILSIAYQCGKIIDHKFPTVKKNEAGKVTSVIFEYQVKSGRWEAREFDESDFERWMRASHKENGRGKNDADANKLNYANANYTSWKGGVDPEFARAKSIRHALKKLGTNPNEGKFNTITIPSEKKIVIDPVIEQEAINDEHTYTEVIEETKNETAMKPEEGFLKNAPSGL